MKNKLTLLGLGIVACLCSSFPSFAQSSYSSVGIESWESYQYRKSHQGTEQATYSTYNGEKKYIEYTFVYGKEKYIAYSFTQSGEVGDWIRDVEGRYFVGEEMYYGCYKVYIRWNHGGEITGSLNYKERSDGKPRLHINNKVYQPE